MENDDENLGKDNESINPNDIHLGLHRYPEAWLLFFYILYKAKLKGCMRHVTRKMYWNLSKLAISNTPFLEAATYSVQVEEQPPATEEPNE